MARLGDGSIRLLDLLLTAGAVFASPHIHTVIVMAKKKKKKWIKGAIKRPGAFKKKAKKAGMSTSAYAKKVTKKGSKASTRTKRQANLAKTLGKMRKKR